MQEDFKKTFVEVLNVLELDDNHLLVTLKHDPDFNIGHKIFLSEEHDARWRSLGIPFVERGQDVPVTTPIGLEPIGHDVKLREGMVLVCEEENI